MSGWSRGPARLDRDSGRPRTRTGEELPPAVTARSEPPVHQLLNLIEISVALQDAGGIRCPGETEGGAGETVRAGAATHTQAGRAAGSLPPPAPRPPPAPPFSPSHPPTASQPDPRPRPPDRGQGTSLEYCGPDIPQR